MYTTVNKSRNMLPVRLSQSAAHTANPVSLSGTFGTFVIHIWSCTVKEFKPVPAVAKYKPLCFLKHQENRRREHAVETDTHSEDFLRLPTRSHVGVVDLFEDHPGFIMLPHLTEGEVGERAKWHEFIRSATVFLTQGQQCSHSCSTLIWILQKGPKNGRDKQ